MTDVVVLEGQYYILATSSLADDRTRVLKHNETFAVFDRFGDIQPIGLGQQGIYHQGTRHLSRSRLRLGTDRPLLLGSTVLPDNWPFAVHLTNLDLYRDGELLVPHGTLHISRSKFIWRGVCYEKVEIANHGLAVVEVDLGLEFEADFCDVFEVRGFQHEGGHPSALASVDGGEVVITYDGLDQVRRATRLSFQPSPTALSPAAAGFHLVLPPQRREVIQLSVACENGDGQARPMPWPLARFRASESVRAAALGDCEITTSSEQFNTWLHRSMADLRMMTTETEHGPYPYAGIPWFDTPFGRDGVITALEALWVNPARARGVLRFLAATQSPNTDPESDAEPGKILHEARKGEMAAIGAVPLARYYGSVDATPLFVSLAAEYYRASGDREFIESIWPNITAALEWIDSFGDADGDGFVEYSRRSSRGLVQQGWKDSHDSVFHADGTPVEGPTALCEVQGYVYAAKRGAAALATALGIRDLPAVLLEQAAALQTRFEEAFWDDELRCYALALDPAKRPCLVRASNAGHALFTGIASPEHAATTAHTLFTPELFSGWGIRTLATTEVRYNPMAYHNGSIWPHDNAMIAHGLASYGFKAMAAQVFSALFDAATTVELARLPELYCGFPRQPGEGPVPYPVACAPQSWAAASILCLLQACLGLEIDAPQQQLRLVRPVLPSFLDHVEIRELRVGAASLDLALQRHPDDVAVNVVRRNGPVEVVVVK